jgi:G3E family GTPase|tara:strand:+ start:9905 stop:10576 length:672 start_codon:yes stop_codon:yes gene_type:complete
MAIATTAAVIGGAANIIGGIFGSSAARRAQRRAAKRARKLKKKLNGLEANRQAIIDPYAAVTDLSSMITNPFSQLGVATQAAEIQIEQADISLANTLDTIRSTGTSAGGATALAQAALKSKQGVAASIEQQEAQNEKMRAEGKKQEEQQLMSEQMRQQDADVQGAQFTFGIREARQQGQIDRTYAELQAARQAAAMASADRTSAITGAIGGVASIAGGFFGKQ